MGKIIGIDMARNIFQRHAMGSGGTVVPGRQLRRGQVSGFCAKRGPCLIGLAAGATLHDWARKFQMLGHDLRLIPPIPVRPHEKRQKVDAAEAICEAGQRPALRFVAVNSAGQQGVLMLHGAPRTSGWPRHRLDQRSARGHFAEFGSVVAQGPLHGGRLVQRVMGRGGCGGRLPPAMPTALAPMVAALLSLGSEIGKPDTAVLAAHQRDRTSVNLATIPSMAPLIASAPA